MSIEKITVPYEFLFRMSESGEIAGMHRRDLEIVRDTETGKIYSATELPPEPVTGENVSLVAGELNASLIATINSLNDQVESLQGQNAELSVEVERLNGVVSDLTLSLAEYDK